MDIQQQLLTSLGIGGSTLMLVAQPAWADLVEVTKVQISQTTNGIELILETGDGSSPQVFSVTRGNEAILDIVNAQLRLPSGNEFSQLNPAPGIVSVTVVPLDSNTLRVTVQGETAAPEFQVRPSDRGLSLSYVAQPARADLVEVTKVQISQTTNGIELILETGDGSSPQVFSVTRGNEAILEIVNAQLRLPSGNSEFSQLNPAPGIVSVNVVPIDGKTLRVTVQGETAAPEFQVRQSNSGLSLSYSAASDPAQTPPTPQPPTAETPQTTSPTPPDRTPETPPGQTDPTQQPPGSQENPDLIRIIVSASRVAQDVANVPRAVTVIPERDIREQTELSNDLGEVVGRAVPGLEAPSDRSFTAGSFRGRNLLVLVDGVPQSPNDSSAGRDLTTIDPSAIERIEVVRGPSAVYGAGATGGVINIITKQASEEGDTGRTEFGVTAAVGNLEKESFGNTFTQNLGINTGPFDFAFTFSRTDNGGVFDGEGDRIASIEGTDERKKLSIFGKLGMDINEEQRLELSASYLDDVRNTSILPDPMVDVLEGRQKARALEVGDITFIQAGPAENQNFIANLEYSNKNLLGSGLQTQIYYRNNSTITDPRDERINRKVIRQQEFSNEKFGGRLQLDTPIGQAVSLLWGADYTKENAGANSRIFFDPEVFDESGGRVFSKTDTVLISPAYELNNVGVFGQLQVDIKNRLLLSGGVRYERVGFTVDDYTSFFAENVKGGDRNFNATVFNLGAVYKPTNTVSLFTSFSQGFSVPNFVEALISLPSGSNIERGVEKLEPQKVNNYEIGVRGDWRKVQASLAAFYNTSDLGSTVVLNENEDFVDIIRAPERIYGVEATVDWQPTRRWQLGGTVSWSEGEADLEDNDNYTPLTGFRIQPLKLTAYIENETLPGWRNRLQAIYVGNRDRAFEEEIDPTKIESYFVVDLISRIPVGFGTVTLGVENLFDTQYYPAYSQLSSGFSDTFYSAGSGRTLSLKYSISW